MGISSGEDAGKQECHLKGFSLEDLTAMESDLDTWLRAIRGHYQKRLQQQLQSVQRRHAEESTGRQTLEEERVCVVCSEWEKTMLFLPCRHLCTCETCAAQLSQCPICRADIDSKVHAFKS